MKIHSTPEQLGGVWANSAAVRHSPHEFTIDFMRFDYDAEGKPQTGVLVQRVNMSPLFVTQLITALQDNWSKYADKAMPRELFGDAGGGDTGGGDVGGGGDTGGGDASDDGDGPAADLPADDS